MASKRELPVVVKGTGEREPFSERKLRRSLRRSGASKADVTRVVHEVRRNLYDGMTTTELYRLARRELRRTPAPNAARYSLQRAVQNLGPSGYPFEHFVAALWKSEGFSTRVGVTLKGRFVSHEVDVVATRKGTKDLAECKFRTQAQGKIDVRTALYVWARSVDLETIRGGFEHYWLVTNGRFTTDALKYGIGMGLAMLSWEHPEQDNLPARIERAGLHPITALTGLRGREQRGLLERRIVLCRDLLEEPAALDELGVSAERSSRILNEAGALCNLATGAGRRSPRVHVRQP